MTRHHDPAPRHHPDEDPDRAHASRRAVIAGAGLTAFGLLQWTPAFRLTPAEAATPAPPGFPSSIPLYQQAFQNWSGEIKVDNLWTAAPATPADVVTMANWAHANGWRLRPRGARLNWSPLVVPAGASGVVLVDTTAHLTAITVHAGSPASVTVQPGATVDAVLAALEPAGYGLTATPAIGENTIGGVLAVGGRGTGIAAQGETLPAGHTFGSLSNLAVSLTAVVWDAGQNRYVLRTFQRGDAEAGALLVHLGRAFITEATLRVGPNRRLRCQSWFNVSADTLFAPPASAGAQSFASYVNSSGRVVCIWFPFTANPWLRVWTVSPNKPLLSRQVTSPYNFPFNDIIPKEVSDLLAQIITGDVSQTPTLMQTQISLVGAGLISTASWDIWGWSKNLLSYVKSSTLRITTTCHAIHTRRADIQRVASEFYAFYKSKLAEYQARGQYPMNAPVEFRVTGLDNPADSQVPGARPALLSPLRARPDHPEWDAVVWVDVVSVPGTPYQNQFYRELETWLRSNYAGAYAAVRPEWSKRFAHTDAGPWTDPAVLAAAIPASYSAGAPAGADWNAARAILSALDPHRVFSNAFLDTLLP
ncbi:cholesterol oxidase substrate-binding domain-containing protein [Pseudofrankia sp. BMG5.36]|uniref:cholesterol oxidase substrate-binding domain-containing protein n=1 Tax=Pseudofrankia sp. BMG5.36 TaxID=1834512 RepID=UPI0008D90580|nr:cholesterol oxidase substrate-binding domain-containing protein [Pseudofrankia sp. BMG5.36]OHV62282.1 FAD-linked oxidase [Pseudofrankia sp. BMG5.36]